MVDAMPTGVPAQARDSWGQLLVASGLARGIIARIDAGAIHYHEIESAAPWGTRRLRSGVDEEWGQAVAAACDGFAQHGAAERLLRNGLIVESQRRVDQLALRPALERFLTSQAIDRSAAVLFAGPPLAGYYQLLADALGGPLINSRRDVWPTEAALDAELAAQPLTLPWSFYLCAAEQCGEQLEIKWLKLLPAGQKPRTVGARRVYERARPSAVYAGPGTSATRLFVRRDDRDVVLAYEVAAASEELLRVACAVVEPAALPTLTVAGKVIRPLHAAEPPALPRILNTGPPLDVAFLLDATLPAADFAHVVAGVSRIAEALGEEARSDIRLGCVVYGEYNHIYPDGRRLRSNLEIETQPFQTPPEFIAQLPSLRSLTIHDNDFCDALELGLQALSGRLDWAANGARRDALRRVILIGHSPPHPIRSELTDYRLSTRSTTEYRGINWRNELDRLRRLPHTRFAAVWVPPPPAQRVHPADLRFARAVWSEIGRDHYQEGFHTGEDSDLLLAAGILAERRMSRYLAAPVAIPLVAPLRDVQPAEATA